MSEVYEDESHPNLDYQSPDWHKIVKFLESEQAEMFKHLIGKDITERESDFLRGRIHQIRMVLDWNPLNGR